MANPEHVEIVKQGTEAIKKWRDENPRARLDLNEAKLSEVKLTAADLSEADLSKAKLIGANLSYATLNYAGCDEADLSEANLNRADLEYTTFSGTNLKNTNFEEAIVNSPHWIEQLREVLKPVSGFDFNLWSIIEMKDPDLSSFYILSSNSKPSSQEKNSRC